jgi:3-hydroxyisobutyrate dehydrogenase
MKVGFIGIGVMGLPMALNLVRSGTEVIAWNRTALRLETLKAAGAQIADNVDEVFKRAKVTILMLADGGAIDSVLGRKTDAFATCVKDHTIIHMGTTSPQYSKDLEADICAAGGRYVEAPVSGSRKPAEDGKLVCMLAGDNQTITEIRELLAPMCQVTILCGSVPKAILMKLSVNVLLISMITAFTEAVSFASLNGIDLKQFMDVLLAGPMANDVLRVKAQKLIAQDFTTQASISNVFENSRLIVEAARLAGAPVPLSETCLDLYDEASRIGLGSQDMVAVIRAIEGRINSKV